MKKFFIPAVLTILSGFYACKKEHTTTVTNVVHDTTIINIIANGIVNADTLSAAVKVGYGSRITGAFPTASADAGAPTLDTLYNKTYKVIKSRYLVIYPPVTSGNVAGYYVQIAGAASYFKVDYTQAYNLRKAKHDYATSRGDVSGYYDSTIVFKLPAAINGDTFHIKYAAYDSLNRVSKPVTGIVLIMPEGNDHFTDSLMGKWRYAGYNYSYPNGTTAFPDFNLDTATADGYGYYSCNGTKLQAMDGGAIYIPNIYYVYREILQFEKYAWNDPYQNVYKSLSLDSSSCSKYVYVDRNVAESGVRGTGGYSYDANTRRLTMVHEESEGNTNTDLHYETYYVNQLTDTSLVVSALSYEEETAYGTYYKKYLKQN